MRRGIVPLTAIMAGLTGWLIVATAHDLLAPALIPLAPVFRWMLP